MIEQATWQAWRPLPDIESGGSFTAPYSAGVYWLRNRVTGEDVCIGASRNVSYRMTCLLPMPIGRPTPETRALWHYVLARAAEIDYSTIACSTPQEAVALGARLRAERRCRF
jgi:hypothetical protein